MKHLLFVTVAFLSFAYSISAQSAASKTLSGQLEKLENKAWDAFGRGDGKFFEGFYAPNAVQVDPNGILSREQAITAIGSKPCELKSFSISNFKAVLIDPTTAFVTYSAVQDVSCGGQKVPEKALASTVYVKRGGKWQGILHQESYSM